MTSPAKIAANRRNARRSTGPRSAAGKARARRNAFRHGLATPASLDHVAMDRINDLIFALTRDFPSKLELELATLAAEAQSEIERVRQAKVSMVKRAYAHLRDWQPHKRMVGVYVRTDGDRGFLGLCFQVNGKPIAQTFELAGSVMRVGGMRWTVKCPDSGKMVRDLYLLLGRDHTHFRSRHALGLSYRSSYFKPKKRHWERAKKLMDRLGATEWADPPLRPKNMQRRTFARLVDELWDAWLSDASANLGVSLDRDALANLGSAELDDIGRKRVTDIALRRRRRKSSN